MNDTVKKACIRSDAIISQVDSYSYELENPETGAVLKLDDTGYIVAEHFEAGDLTVDEVVESLQNQHHLKIAKPDVLDFLKRADALALLKKPLSELDIEVDSQMIPEDEYAPTGQMEDTQSILKLYRSRLYRVYFSFNPKTWGIALATILMMLIPWPYKAAGNLIIKPKNQITIRTPVAGTVKSIHVSEGDEVAKGQLLAQLGGYESDIALKQTEIVKVSAELEELEAGATQAEINGAKKKVALAQKITSQAEEKTRRYEDLFAQNLISEQELRDTSAVYEIKQKELEQALAQLALVEGGTRPELIRAKKAELQAFTLDVELLKTLQDLREIRSPMAGIVTTPSLSELLGKKMNPGDAIVTVSFSKLLLVEIVIQERDISLIEEGQSMNFKLHALPAETFSTTVTRISPIGVISTLGLAQEQGSLFRVYCEMENAEQRILPGMTGVGRIYIESRLLGQFVFSRLIRHIRVNYGV